MMIIIDIDDYLFVTNYIVFNGGEVQTTFDEYFPPTAENIRIEAILKNSDDVMSLIQVAETIKETFPDVKRNLVLKYFPYARQDRKCQPRETFAFKIFANLINSLNFAEVEVWDLHNEDVAYLINNVRLVKQKDLVRKLEKGYDLICLPDAGAHKKYVSHNAKTLIKGSKVRDVETGEITKTVYECRESLEGKKILIVDDLADNGMTFYYLAEQLRKEKPRKIDLYVTHAIFKNGIGKLPEVIDNILTTDSLGKIKPNVVILNPKIKGL